MPILGKVLRTSWKRSKNGGDGGTGVYMREGTTSRVTAPDRPYCEFYDFYSVSPENFESTLVCTDKRAISRALPKKAVIAQLKRIETPFKTRGIHPFDSYIHVELTGVGGTANVSIYTHGSKTQNHVGAGMVSVNPLNAGLNPICYLLALSGVHHILHISGARVKNSREIHIETQRQYRMYGISSRALRHWHGNGLGPEPTEENRILRNQYRFKSSITRHRQ